ncbi:MAG: Crp/Fnr family transcriptional regulator [Gemmatimonadales bacterium]
MVDITAQTLAGIGAFRGLSATDRGALARQCRAHLYSANEQIVSHQDESTDVYFIVSGSVRVTTYSPSRKEITFRDLEAGQMFGHLAAIDNQPRSASVLALTDSLIASMSASTFLETLQKYPAVCLITLRELAGLVRLLSERVVEFSTLGVKNRIHAELLRLANKNIQGDNTATISPAPTHADLASRISTHREAVTRELNHLTQAGLIERRHGALVINDVKRLALMVQDIRGK